VGLTPDTYLAPLFLSDSPDNVTGYNLGFADAGIAAARALATEDERLAGYQEVERAIVGQVPLVPLVQLQSHAVVSDRVRDLTTRVNGTIDAEVVTVE
jgi:ABC-type oligopeptide transport system substrate-binding subunit